MQDVWTESKLLPSDPDLLPETIQVVFVGPNRPIPTDPVLISRIGVNRTRLRAAAQFLLTEPQYKAVYGDCKLSEDNLNKFPDNGIPQSLLRALIYSGDNISAKRDRAGHTLQEQSDDSDSEGEDKEMDVGPDGLLPVPSRKRAGILVRVGGAVDAEASAVTVKQLHDAIHSRRDGVALVLPAGPKPVSDYTPLFWLGAFLIYILTAWAPSAMTGLSNWLRRFMPST